MYEYNFDCIVVVVIIYLKNQVRLLVNKDSQYRDFLLKWSLVASPRSSPIKKILRVLQVLTCNLLKLSGPLTLLARPRLLQNLDMKSPVVMRSTLVLSALKISLKERPISLLDTLDTERK